MTDKNIKRFSYEVQVKDSGQFARQYGMLYSTFTEGLREQGYVPVLDLDPHISVMYDEKVEAFNYVLTIQTIYVGRKIACKTLGIANGKLLGRTTQSRKSKPS